MTCLTGEVPQSDQRLASACMKHGCECANEGGLARGVTAAPSTISVGATVDCYLSNTMCAATQHTSAGTSASPGALSPLTRLATLRTGRRTTQTLPSKTQAWHNWPSPQSLTLAGIGTFDGLGTPSYG